MTEQQGTPILEVSGLTMQFGGIRALDKLDLRIRHRKIAALIGPNGAGKTTFFNCLTGIYKPTSGTIRVQPPGRKSKRL
ncbi:MAG: ATP-binding cassette domain-containing protein, partial [Candidatus Electrothrix sp. EH2]|nr:ATP-binding cassette domain-containing protein [Candidatus Electrothrix sp. EH2]